jgi:hypothetical protein
MRTRHKTLLVRFDFILDRSRGGDRLVFKRWRRVLAAALPGLMGLSRCCPRAVLRLRHGEEQGRFSGWLRIPVERHPGLDRLRRIREKLQEKLESVLIAVGGEVLKVVVRRLRPRTALSLAVPPVGGVEDRPAIATAG